eukprot:TRINITY_DN5835_c0_g1_i1.p1 TRINITY_DN5835_c0_g1~~TRINITY_DN5835_c0_g1_i1.p1  ORF type:complete len:242 (-),score=68.66 TRINITY_DN5835_c0_g1_i1:460-1185(-)
MAPMGAAVAQGEIEGSDLRWQEETILLCPDQREWLDDVAVRYLNRPLENEADVPALRRLVELSNGEPPKTKQQIFLVVRCHRCLQHTRGGDKKECQIMLPELQWRWLEAVRERSRHATLGKTLRIIIDFYKPICEKDREFERAVFQVLGAGDDLEAVDSKGAREDANTSALSTSSTEEERMLGTPGNEESAKTMDLKGKPSCTSLVSTAASCDSLLSESPGRDSPTSALSGTGAWCSPAKA